MHTQNDQKELSDIPLHRPVDANTMNPQGVQRMKQPIQYPVTKGAVALVFFLLYPPLVYTASSALQQNTRQSLHSDSTNKRDTRNQVTTNISQVTTNISQVTTNISQVTTNIWQDADYIISSQ